MNLPGWKCLPPCSAFNGEAKGRMDACRACGALRPAEIDGLDEVLHRDDLTEGERVVFSDMRRAIEVHGARLTEGQIGWLATVRRRPEKRKTVQEAAMELEIGPARRLHPILVFSIFAGVALFLFWGIYAEIVLLHR